MHYISLYISENTALGKKLIAINLSHFSVNSTSFMGRDKKITISSAKEQEWQTVYTIFESVSHMVL